MITVECKQGTHEWHQARLGVVTASKVSAIITPTGKPTSGQKRRRYAIELACQRLTKRPTDTPTTWAMQRGTDLEPLARVWYTLETGRGVREVGFCLSDDRTTGASPDGLVGDDGAIEIKCPGVATYAEIVASGEIPDDHLLQCHHVLYVTGRRWIDYVLFSDIEPFRGWVKRIERDTVVCGKINAAVQEFNSEVDELVKAIIQGARITQAQLDFAAPIFNSDGEQVISNGTMEASEL